MATPIALDDALAQILDAVLARIAEARADVAGEPPTPGPLGDLADVILGDRARVGFELPVLWVLGGTATVIERHMLQETWQLPIALYAVVKGDEPETAARAVMSLAARARTAVLRYDDDRQYRRLGLAFVDDLQSFSFEPARETRLENRVLYGAAATINVRFRVFERT